MYKYTHVNYTSFCVQVHVQYIIQCICSSILKRVMHFNLAKFLGWLYIQCLGLGDKRTPAILVIYI